MLLYNGRIVTMAGEDYASGYVEIKDDRIAKTGPGQPARQMIERNKDNLIDLDGAWVLPGLIDAHSHIGLFNDGIGREGYDANESSNPVMPQMQALDGLFPDDYCFGEALSYGVTSVLTGPGSANVLSGTFSLVHTVGRHADQMVIIKKAAMKAALGENPKKAHGSKDRSPKTRMANAAILREALTKASYYKKKKEHELSSDNAGKQFFEPDARWEALLPVLNGEMILKIHAHRSDDILTAVRIAYEFGLRFTLDHCTEGYQIADILKKVYEKGLDEQHGCGIAGQSRLEGVITGPLLSDRSKPELARSRMENTAVLAATGIPVAIMTDHPVIPEQYLALSAAAAVRAGLKPADALAAITINAARISGAADRLGSLEAGKKADLAIFSKDPFDYLSQTKLVIIDGRKVWRQDEDSRGDD